MDAPPVLVAVARDASRQLHRKVAQSWGWEAHEVSTGEELFAKLSVYRYSAVLIDAELADCDLLEVAALVRGLKAGWQPKLILLAPFNRRTMAEVGLEARPGFAAMLPRPLRQAEWRHVLQRAVTGEPEAETSIGGQLLAFDKEIAEPAPAVVQAPAAPILRILVTEDNVVNQKVALKLIQKLGYDADLAANGREAVNMLSTRSYALVFMDCQMPILDGYGATAEIRRLEGDDCRTPIVAMTAHAMQGDREKCLAAGMDDYLTKPIQISELRRAIEQWAKPDLVETAI
jgi:CheY-like chemotaxis protein